MHSPKTLMLLGIGISAALSAHGQSIGPSAIDAAGSSATVSGNTYESAIGQVVAGNPSPGSSNLIVTPGVLQPVFVGLGVATRQPMLGNLTVYPAPVETTLYLQPAFNGGGILRYCLYDAGGKLVLSRESQLAGGTERQSLSVVSLAAGQYNLQVAWIQDGQTSAATYKVQKLR